MVKFKLSEYVVYIPQPMEDHYYSLEKLYEMIEKLEITLEPSTDCVWDMYCAANELFENLPDTWKELDD